MASVDIGTNNCRLLVARADVHGYRVLDTFSRIVRLGEGLSFTDRLSESAMTRAIQALEVCAIKIARKKATVVRAVATEACRRAANGPEFIERVRHHTGLILETITTEEEARLALAACAPLLNADSPLALVFDIGGGSTEVLFTALEGGNLRVQDHVSLPVGVVNLSESHNDGHLSVEVYEAMVARVADLLRAFDQRNSIGSAVAVGQVQMLGTSGTVTTLGGIHLGLVRYERSKVDGMTLPLSVVFRISRELLSMNFAQRAALPCIGTDRADLVLSGCAVLEAMCGLWPVPQLRIADRGLREGIVAEIMQSYGAASAPLTRSVWGGR